MTVARDLARPRLARVDGPHLDVASVVLPSQYVARAMARHPTRTALLYKDRITTYAQLERAVGALSGWLGSHGIAAGDRVAYLGRNSDLFLIAALGCLGAGVTFVPLNWRLSAAEIDFILEDSGVRLVIAEPEFLDLIDSLARANLSTAITDSATAGDLHSVLVSAAGSTPTGGPADHSVSGAESPWLLCYTSGTTGSPKGVQISEAAFGNARAAECGAPAYADWSDHEVVLAAMPLFHVGGLSWAFGALARGLSCVVSADAAPAVILDLCAQHAINRVFAVPTVIGALVTVAQERSISLPALRGIHYGAAPMDTALLQSAIRQFRCAFVQHFGMTETCGCGTLLAPTDHVCEDLSRLQSLGLPLPGVSVEIRDVSTKCACATGEPGEIWIRGQMLMSGYAGRTEATASALENGWYRSGDGGFLDDAGYLFLTDRIKDLIITGGENVYPAEIERVLKQHPAVVDAAVFGVPDAHWGERIVAAVELNAGMAGDPQSLLDHARRSLAGFKIPRQIEFNSTLPRTASGKIQRGLARARFLAAQEPGQ